MDAVPPSRTNIGIARVILSGVAIAIDTLRQGYEALNRGDVSAVLALIDEDIVWIEGDRSLGAGEHHGRDSFTAFLHSWLDAFEEFRIELTDVIDRDEHVVAVGHQSGTGRAS